MKWSVAFLHNICFKEHLFATKIGHSGHLVSHCADSCAGWHGLVVKSRKMILLIRAEGKQHKPFFLLRCTSHLTLSNKFSPLPIVTPVRIGCTLSFASSPSL
uniref:Uncharacterized protein n=1 Tax=Rhipicephalus zambeziensis TaxID=60191 RepID=A0A224YC66_9ACAR